MLFKVTMRHLLRHLRDPLGWDWRCATLPPALAKLYGLPLETALGAAVEYRAYVRPAVDLDEEDSDCDNIKIAPMPGVSF